MKQGVAKYPLILIVIAGYCVLLFPGCHKEPSSPIIARAGKSVLTLEDLYKSIPPEYSDQITREQNVNYVKQWIDTELLYQDALRKRIDRERVIRDRLEKMKKDLLSAEMISRNSLATQLTTITDQAVHEYYLQHQNEFVRDQDVARYLEIVFDNAQMATDIRRTLSADNFLTMAMQFSQQPATDIAEVPFVPLEDIPPQVRQIIQNTALGTISNPVKTEIGYHIVQVLDKKEKGGICTEEEVRGEIFNLLSSKTQKAEVSKLLSDLRLKTDVEFNFDLIPGYQASADSTGS